MLHRSRTPFESMMRGLGLLFLMAAGSVCWASVASETELSTPTGVIHGTLLLPDAAARPPVVVLIAGSGPTDRNGNGPVQGGYKPDTLKLLAQALGEAGIASLRYDKRGVGASAPALKSEADIRFGDYVDDAAAWVDQLRRDKRFSSVAIVGHSEGALIGTLAADRSNPQALVSIAGSGENALALLRKQLKGALPPDLVKPNADILASLERGETVKDIPAPLLALYRPSVQPYLISWFRITPTDAIAKLKSLPVLIIQGDKDKQISVADAEALHSAYPSSKIVIVKGMDHTLKSVAATEAEQAQPTADTAPLSPDFVQAVRDFLRQHLRRP